MVFPHAGNFSNLLDRPFKVAKDFLPASKGDIERQERRFELNEAIIFQLVKQVNALTPVGGIAPAVYCCKQQTGDQC